MRIAIFYHCLFYLGNPPELLQAATPIISQQMLIMESNGLLAAADYLIVGVNGGEESRHLARMVFPAKAKICMNGLQCRTENRTIEVMEKWLEMAPSDYLVLYLHSKGATRPTGDDTGRRWRNCMMRHNVTRWRQCVADLQAGYEAVGCHWMTGAATPPGQSIFAGNFWWAKASFLQTLPPIRERARIKESGLDAVESRYESEVWLGNGPRLPRVKDYHGPDWNPSKVATCE